MILMYHKVDIVSPSEWWVTVENFAQQISLLQEKYEIVHLDQYQLGSKNQAVITFDDVYENVFTHAFPILRKHGIPFELFVNGNLIGGWNHFDRDEMLTRFCDLHHLKTMVNAGGRVQWHTMNHKYLPGLSAQEIEQELAIPSDLSAAFPAPNFQWFVYPYGMHSQQALDKVRSKFVGALSVCEGCDDDRHLLNRVVVNNQWRPL